MGVLVQKHREAPVWKLYDANKSYLGQILGTDKESMPELAEKMSNILLGIEDADYTTEILDDGSMNITDKVTGKRVGAFEKEFKTLSDAIKRNLE